VDQTYIDSWARITKENSTALRELRDKHRVNLVRTPDPVHTAVLKAWDRLAERESKDPFFRKVYESMRAYASTVVPYRKLMWGAVEVARDYYWEPHYIT
jgi:TRAP-type mannitol/chloroaromatic compound transport system substrate-binding protein